MLTWVKLFSNWLLVLYQQIQALGFPYIPQKLGLHEKPQACIYYLPTGCEDHTRKYKPEVFHTARVCEGYVENQGLVFPSMAEHPVSKLLII